jgi:uncharacterized repeat protein (TIGR03803 family)
MKLQIRRSAMLAPLMCIPFVFCLATAKVSPAQATLITLVNFNGSDGSWPNLMTLTQGSDGRLYGTTLFGGSNCTDGLGCGTVFKMTSSGTLTTLYSFCSQANCTDGDQPVG